MEGSKTDPASEGDADGIYGLCLDPMVEEALGFKHKRRSLQEIVQSTRKEAAELIGYNEKSISTTIGGSSSKELSQESEETPSALSQGLDMSLSALPQVPENTPSKLPQVPAMTAPKFPQVPEKTPSKLSQVPATTAQSPQVPEKTPSKLSQVPATTAPKLPQVLEKTLSKLLHEQTPIPSNFNVQKKNEASPTARMQLYEICAARHWKRPLFVLSKEEGPRHQRMFTFKVILELKGISTTDLECYSEPRQQKKAAQENAAEGALWYLKHLGVLPKT